MSQHHTLCMTCKCVIGCYFNGSGIKLTCPDNIYTCRNICPEMKPEDDKKASHGVCPDCYEEARSNYYLRGLA